MIGLLAAMAIAGAPPPYIVPSPGTELRRQVINALRPAIAKRLGPNLEFRVAVIRVQRDWAFVVADPQRRGGKPIDGWRTFGKQFGDMDGLRVDAVLQRRGGGWTLIDHAIGATDVWYCDVGPRSIKAGWGC